MKKVGFIGLGNMGFFMSKNLVSNNCEVEGYDINQDIFIKLKNFNIIQKSSINEISDKNDVIITMLPNGKIVKEVWQLLLKQLKPNTLLVDCSTIDLETTKNLHEMAQINNVLSLDAPVSGGTIGAENGTLTFMVGGKKNAYQRMVPLFEIMGNKSILCGKAGSGQATKMCNNLVLAITMFGLGEAIKLANSQSLDMEKFYEVLSTSTASCWALNNYTPIKGVGPISPADNDFKPGFSSNLMFKDLSLALSAASNANLNLDFGNRILNKYKEHIKLNKGDLDFSDIINEIH
jgi:3-hydroxyisobutyrate dehydrogenase